MSRSSLAAIAGRLLAATSVAFVVFYLVFVYSRPSRFGDPLAGLAGPSHGTTRTYRILDRLIEQDGAIAWNAMPRTDGAPGIRNYPYRAEAVIGSEQIGIGVLKDGELDTMSAWVSGLPSDRRVVVSVPPDGRLEFSIGLLAPYESGVPSSARFVVRLQDLEERTPAETIFSRTIQSAPGLGDLSRKIRFDKYLVPDSRGRYGAWSGAKVDLSRFSGRRVELAFTTEEVSETSQDTTALWGDPVLVGPKDGAPPNVILIVIDSLRVDAVGSYQPERTTTPNIDGLAHEGVLFEQARSNAIDTRTSTTSLLTGRYAGELGVHFRNRGVSELERRHFREIAPTTLPALLAENGYATAAFANNMFLLEFTGAGYDLGFQRVYNNDRPRWDTMEITDRAIRWIDSVRDRPFFLFFNLNSPHGLYRPPIRNLFQASGFFDLARYDLYSWYLGSVAHADEYVGVLGRALDRMGISDDTLIIVTADHGQVFDAAHDYEISGRSERTYNRHGFTLYDEELRVPLILRAPGRLPAGRRVAEAVSLVDLFPTIVQIAGFEPPGNVAGRSLVESSFGKTGPERAVFAEGRQSRAIIWNRQKLILREGESARYLINDDREPRLVHLEEELFDLEDDPAEHHDVSRDPAYTAVRQALINRIWTEGPIPPMLTHLRIVAGPEAGFFEGTVRVKGRVRFVSSVEDTDQPTPLILEPRENTVRFSADLKPGQSAELLIETDPTNAPIRIDLSQDGAPLGPERFFGGPGGLPGIISAADWIEGSELALLASRAGTLAAPIVLSDRETGAFVWRSSYLDEMTEIGASQRLGREVRDVLLDWGYIQSGKHR